MFDLIAFDGDDTLWHNENLDHESQNKFGEIMADYCSSEIAQYFLYQTEMSNLDNFGYGIKSCILSMIETALELSQGSLKPNKIAQILSLTCKMLSAEVNLLGDVVETITNLADRYTLLIITKVAFFDQKKLVFRSGMARFFRQVTIVNHKNVTSYANVLDRLNCIPEHFLIVGNSLRSDILPVFDMGGWAFYIPCPLTWEHESQVDKNISCERFYPLTNI